MKKFKLVLLTLLGSLLFAACSKGTDTPTSKDTALELTVKDGLGNKVTGASVKLYASETDWRNQKNQVQSTQFSDASGKVKFTGLSAIKYYFFIEKDCQNNYNGGMTLVNPLIKDKTGTADIILSKTGNLYLKSKSSNPYRIYINGNPVFDMNGGETRTISYIPQGSYNVRVLQLSGYIFSPTDKSYTAPISCGATTSVVFP